MTSDERLRADLASLKIDRPPVGTAPPRRPRRGWVRWVLLIAAVAAIVGGGAWLLFGRIPTVTVAVARRVSAAQSGPAPVLSGSGYVVTGDRYVQVGVRVPGRIDRYFVEEGQTVQKDAALVQLDDRDYRAALARIEAGVRVARANLTLAESELNRGEALRGKAVISQQEFDVLANKAAVARATVSQLDAELQQAKVNLEYTTLRAPTDGVVLAKLKEVGEIAVPGGFAGSGDLIRLANMSDLRAEVDVNEADLNRVRMGQPAEVIPDAYPDRRYPARVVKLYPQVDRQKGTLKVEVQLTAPDDKLLPDMSARVTFLEAEPGDNGTEPQTTVLVPAAALHRAAAGGNFVWVVSDARVRQTVVDTAGDVGEDVRIATGLNGGESVVVGDAPLEDGQRVTVLPPQPQP